jgi:hypothetical protein
MSRAWLVLDHASDRRPCGASSGRAGTLAAVAATRYPAGPSSLALRLLRCVDRPSAAPCCGGVFPAARSARHGVLALTVSRERSLLAGGTPSSRSPGPRDDERSSRAQRRGHWTAEVATRTLTAGDTVPAAAPLSARNGCPPTGPDRAAGAWHLKAADARASRHANRCHSVPWAVAGLVIGSEAAAQIPRKL